MRDYYCTSTLIIDDSYSGEKKEKNELDEEGKGSVFVGCWIEVQCSLSSFAFTLPMFATIGCKSWKHCFSHCSGNSFQHNENSNGCLLSLIDLWKNGFWV